MIEVVREYNDFLALKDSWNAVLENSSHDHVCLTFEWIWSWWKAFGKNKKLLVILVKDDAGNLSAIAPFMLSKARVLGLALNKLSFIYNNNSSQADFLISGKREEALKAIIKSLAEKIKDWNFMELENIPVESLNYALLKEELSRNNLVFGIKEGLRSPFIPIDKDWDKFISCRSKKFRKLYKKICNRLSGNRGYEIKKIENNRKENRVLDQVFAIASRSWKAKLKYDLANSKENQNFFRKLSSLAIKRGWQQIWILSIDGQPAAYEYLLSYKDRLYALRSDFDENYRHLVPGPGNILNMQIINSCFGDGLKEFDFCGHNDSYKLKFTEECREHATFLIYRNNLSGRILYLWEYRVCYLLKKFLKRFKFLAKVKQSFRR